MLSPTFSSVLAIVVALASLFLFLISFIAPRLYRAQDLWWSGVGLFYALVLWFCSAQIRGAVLLGTIASVSLLGWLSTQVYLSRWALLTDAEKAGGSLKQFQALGQQLHRLLESRPSQAAAPETATQTPEAPQADPISKNTGTKTGKVRWVRPEKPQDAPVQPQADAPLSDPSLTDTPITDLPKDSQAIVDTPLETAAPAETSEPIQPPEPIVPSESQPAETIVSPSAEPPLAPTVKTVDEWDEMEADLEEGVEDGVKEATSEKPPIPSGTPKAEANAQTEAKTGVVKRIQNFFQGRKSHGKRFVRPEDEPVVPSKPAPRPEPSANSSVETAPPELSELPTPETIEIPTNLTPDPISEIAAIPEPSETENTQKPLAASESSNVSEDPTLNVSLEDVAPETPEDVALEDVAPETPEDVASETPEDVALETPEDVAPEASEDAASEVPEDVAPETPKDIAPKTSEEITPEDIAPKDIAPKDGTPETIETTNTSAVEPSAVERG